MSEEISGDITSAALSPSASLDSTLSAASSSGQDASTSVSSGGSDATTSAVAADVTPGAGSKSHVQAEPASMADAIAAAFDMAVTSVTRSDQPDANAPAGQGARASDGSEVEAEADADAMGDDAADASDGSRSQPGADKQSDLPDPSPEELAAMQPGTRKRVKTLLRQRAALREQVAALEPDAANYRQIVQFIESNGLTHQDAAQAMFLAADLVSGEPARLRRAVALIMPRVRAAMEALGEALPDDLSKRVDAGEMTEDAAREFAAARFRAQAAQAQAERAAQQVQQREAQDLQNRIRSTLADWTARIKQTDPDYDRKVDLMVLESKALVAEKGFPRTPQEAIEYAHLAHKRATEKVQRLMPRPLATRPTPSTTTAATRGAAQPQPMSLEEAIGQAFDSAVR